MFVTFGIRITTEMDYVYMYDSCGLIDGRPTGWHSAAASALEEAVKIRTISREAVSCNAGLGADPGRHAHGPTV